MRNKILLGFSFVLMVFVLAGCISIPIGDSSLEISTDGIDFVPAGSTGLNNNDNGDIFDMFGNDNNNNDMNSDNDNDFNATNNDDANNSGSEVMGQGGPAFGTCTEEMDHSPFFKYVDYDLWLPDCAELENRVQTYANSVAGDFHVPGADWEGLADEYEEVLGVNGKLNFENQTADIGAELSNGGEVRVEISQVDEEGYVRLYISYWYPQED